MVPPCSRLLQHSLRVWLLVVNGQSCSVPHPTPASQPPAPGKSLCPKHPVRRMEGLFAPSVIQRFKSKIFIRFYTEFFFFLLKIVLRVLASVDIKITVMCKTRTRKRLIRV